MALSLDPPSPDASDLRLLSVSEVVHNVQLSRVLSEPTCDRTSRIATSISSCTIKPCPRGIFSPPTVSQSQNSTSVVMTSSTPSPLGGVLGGGLSSLPSSPSSSTGGGAAHSEKSRRYDRQLRLWGDHGQGCLERAHVCLLGAANATGCEVLKSLVLPGIGAFTIVDAKTVTKEDAGNNFFLDLDSVGQKRGSVACNFLLEMNNEVRGDFVDETPEHILANRPEFFRSFSLVIVTEITEKSLLILSRVLWDANTPLLLLRSYGFLGYIRLQIKEHTVVESHPDNELQDFRLDCPFPGLVNYMSTQDMSTMNKQQHSHTPYLVILYQYLQKWKQEHNGFIPKNYKEKTEFKDMIQEGKLKNADGVPEDEENFDEAIAAVNTALSHYTIPVEVKAILDDPKCVQLTSKSSDFWIICRAVKDFVEEDGNGELPISGQIPDMFSDTERYVQLQNVYREKAILDAENISKRVQTHLEQVGRPAESVSEATVKRFCRQAHHLNLVRGGESIEEEFLGRSPHTTDVGKLFDQDPDNSAMYYFILRGVDRFYSKNNTLPGACDDHVEPDIGKLKNCVAEVISEYQLPSVVCKDDFVHEVCRYGGAELHSIASVIGGCAAQEAIKLITGQYVPINNLFIYNTMTSETITLKI